jgi:DNA-binding MarR family transcriptional regulator
MQRRSRPGFSEVTGSAARTDLKTSHQAGSPAQREILRGLANQIRFWRDLRLKSFDRNMFGEPAWDILLTLYIIDGDQRRLSTRDVSRRANLPLTTALRWLDYLDEQELIERKSDRFDRRVLYIELSDKGRAAMDNYLTEMHEADVFAAPAANPQSGRERPELEQS